MELAQCEGVGGKDKSVPSSAWVQRFGSRVKTSARLFCFSYAGGGASVYRLWHKGLPTDVDVCAIQLPGRETRMHEAPLVSITALVDELVTAIRAQSDVPFAFFGHSMGAVLASEVALALQAEGSPLPEHLFLSARRPWFVPDPEPPLSHLPDAAFVAELDRRYGGIPKEVLQHRELMALLLPGLRADLAALEAPRAMTDTTLSMPLTVYGGIEDSRVPQDHLEAWRSAGSGPFRLRMFPGGHFYLNHQRDALLEDIKATLAPMLMRAADRMAPS